MFIHNLSFTVRPLLDEHWVPLPSACIQLIGSKTEDGKARDAHTHTPPTNAAALSIYLTSQQQ